MQQHFLIAGGQTPLLCHVLLASHPEATCKDVPHSTVFGARRLVPVAAPPDAQCIIYFSYVWAQKPPDNFSKRPVMSILNVTKTLVSWLKVVRATQHSTAIFTPLGHFVNRIVQLLPSSFHTDTKDFTLKSAASRQDTQPFCVWIRRGGINRVNLTPQE